MDAPLSSYSSFLIHISSNALKLVKILPPIHTEYFLSGGAMILKLEDIKNIKNKVNINSKLNEMIKYSTNEQLNQFSNIYFNKVKKNIQINEL